MPPPLDNPGKMCYYYTVIKSTTTADLFDSHLNNTQEYRSGHNEAVLKCLTDIGRSRAEIP